MTRMMSPGFMTYPKSKPIWMLDALNVLTPHWKSSQFPLQGYSSFRLEAINRHIKLEIQFTEPANARKNKTSMNTSFRFYLLKSSLDLQHC